MSTTNRFLSTSQQIGTLATEKTLQNIDDFIKSGALEVNATILGGSGSQDSIIKDINFTTTQTDTLNIQTNGLLDKVKCSIDASDVTGNIPVEVSSVTITDVNNSGTQTTNLETNNPSVKTAGIDTYTENTTKLSLIGGVRVDSPTSGFPVTNNNEIAPLCLNEDGSVYTSCRELPSNLVTNDNLKTNIERIGGQLIQLGSGNLTNCQRVVIATNDINLNNISLNSSTNRAANVSSLTNLTSIDGKIPTKGQKASSGSVPSVLSADYLSTVKNDITLLKGLSINSGIGMADNQTLRVVLTSDYLSTCTVSTPLHSKYYRRTQLYVSATTSGSGTFVGSELARDWTTAPNSGPFETSMLIEAALDNLVFIREVEVYMEINGNPHNTGWGTDASLLSAGIGAYYKFTSFGPIVTLINDGASTNVLEFNPIRGNSGFKEHFDDFNYDDIGGGARTFKFIKRFDPPIRITNTGSYYWNIPKLDLSSDGVQTLKVYVNYYS